MEKLKSELKQLIIEALHLEDISEEDIEDDAPLFVEGLGLDSIDALELSVALEKKYQIQIEDEEKARKAFYSIHTLAEFIQSFKNN